MANLLQVRETGPGALHTAAWRPEYPAGKHPRCGLQRLGSHLLAFWLAVTSCLTCSQLGMASQWQPQTNAPPAKLKISGYGFLGNRELKRILRTLELAGKKTQFFQ